MEPFPGLETRRDLSRKLNVSARQVQVWFQNKRQRERKLSRAKGLLSTPGLPDTPAVAAAHAKMQANGINVVGESSPGLQWPGPPDRQRRFGQAATTLRSRRAQ